jgi:hypothetical protein
MPSTRQRVPLHTTPAVNESIQSTASRRVRYFESRRGEIADRLQELADEWDIERAIQANASVLAFSGIAMAAVTRDRRWLAVPAVVSAFLFQHAVHGWCPPVPILRALGFRTSYEIEEERNALKALRGDYDFVKGSKDKPNAALQAARR